MDRGNSAPVATGLCLSTPTCSRKGDPPFVVTIHHQPKASRPIWALVYDFTDWCSGIEVRDFKFHRRIGPSLGMAAFANLDEDPDPLDDTSLHYLTSEQPLNIAYTFCVHMKESGFRSDVDKLKDGQRYDITLRKQRWWWMFEDDMPKDCTTDQERREILSKQTCCVWKPQCVAEFDMVE